MLAERERRRVMDIRVSQPFILALALNNYDPFFGAEKKKGSKDLEEQVYLQVLDYIKTASQR
jgi:hypothetical protein